MKIIIKKIAVVLIVVLCIASLAACQSNTVDQEPENPIKQEENTGKENEGPATGNTKLKELAIQYEGKSLQISGAANEDMLKDMFGAALEKKTHTYTAEDNMDPHLGKTTNEYKFPGIMIRTINTLEEKDKFYVYQMEVSDPKYTTPSLIKVGDSLDKLKEVYPEASLVPDSEGYYLYRPVDHFDTMAFTILDNKISNIKIYTLLE